MPNTSHPPVHQRVDRCPGICRPWIADDGALVRIRLVGGQLDRPADLLDLARYWGDGALHLTSRANVQLRGVRHEVGTPPAAFVDELRDLGLLPSPEHDRVRNILMSPLTGLVGGRTDLRPVAADLDRLILARPDLARLPGKFLFVLDDGRGDVVGRPADLGLVALDDEWAQLRLGVLGWGPLVRLDWAALALTELAEKFCLRAELAEGIPWHVDELTEDLVEPSAPRPAALVHSDPPPFGPAGPALHVEVPDGRITSAEHLAGSIVVTPWKSLVVPA